MILSKVYQETNKFASQLLYFLWKWPRGFAETLQIYDPFSFDAHHLRALMYTSGWECKNEEVIISRKDCETHQECVKRLFPLGLRTAGCRAQSNHQSGNISTKLLRCKMSLILAAFFFSLSLSFSFFSFFKVHDEDSFHWNVALNSSTERILVKFESFIHISYYNLLHIINKRECIEHFSILCSYFLEQKNERRRMCR